MLTTQLKKLTLEALNIRRQNFEGSDNKFATSIGINSAQYSRIKNGDIDKVISESSWITLARELGVNIHGKAAWRTAETKVFKTISAQLRKCQTDSISAMLCDDAGIGKTYTARAYKAANKSVAYVDCSQVKSKQKFVRALAKEFGVGHTGKYSDVYDDLVFYIKTISNPLVILDEAGDLDYSAFLELKALWNAVEDYCGWYMMGADGLKEKIRRAMDNKKVGFVEIFSRYGKRYLRVTPQGKEDYDEFTKLEAALIIKANAPAGADVNKILIKTDGSLRRIHTEISKL